MAKPLIGVLAVQGAFIEHEHKLEQLGAQCVELRQASDLNQQFDGIVLPGGESTVQGKLLRELGMFEDLQARIVGGIPVLATCAGMILLANEVSQGKGTGAKSLSTFAESVAGSTLHVTGDTPDPAAAALFRHHEHQGSSQRIRSPVGQLPHYRGIQGARRGSHDVYSRPPG